MEISFDLNARVDPILQNPETIADEPAQRVAAIALPFLALHPMTSLLSSVGMGVHRIYTADTLWQAAECVGALALSILIPGVYHAGAQTYLLAQRIWTLVSLLSQGEGRAAAYELLEIALQMVYIASLLSGLREVRALSLVCQAAKELAEGLAAWNEGLLPEAAAKICLAAIRSSQAVPLVRTLKRDWFGQALTQQKKEEIAWKCRMHRYFREAEPIDLTTYLEEENISGFIRGIDFEDDDFDRMILRDLHFQECDFSDATFDHAELYHVGFDRCLMSGARWIQAVADDVFFHNSELESSSMIRSLLHRVSYKDCNLNHVCFNSSTLNAFTIESSSLSETSFLDAEVRQGTLCDCDLTNTLLTTAKEHFHYDRCSAPVMTKPVVALSWNFRDPRTFGPIIDKALQVNGAIPLLFEYAPDDIDVDALTREVEEGLQKIEPPALSRADELLQMKSAEISKMRKKAEEICRHVQGIALTGGYDVEPMFYGQTPEEETHSEADVRRSVMEFAMLRQARLRALPAMGTCRGSQMINVYQGGTLKQAVDGQMGSQNLEWTDAGLSSELHEAIGDNWSAYSSHHQASQVMGKDLEVIATHDGIPKMFVSRDGQWIGSQVHPEIHVQLQDLLDDPDFDILPEQRRRLLEVLEENRAVYRYFVRRCSF